MKKEYPFIEWRHKAYTFSIGLAAVFLVVSLFRGVNLGIDFVGGTSVAVKFDKPVDNKMLAEIRSHLEPRGLGGNIRTIGGAGGSAEEARQISIDIRGSGGIDKMVESFEKALAAGQLNTPDDLDKVFGVTLQPVALAKLKSYFLPPPSETATPALYDLKKIARSDLQNIVQGVFNDNVAIAVHDILAEKMPSAETVKDFDINEKHTGEELAAALAEVKRGMLEARLAELMADTTKRSWKTVDEFLTASDMTSFDGPGLRRRLSADTMPASGVASVLSATPHQLSEAFMEVFTERFRRNAGIVVARRDADHGGMFASTAQAVDYVPQDDPDMRRMLSEHGYVGRFIIASSDAVGATIGADMLQDALLAVSFSIMGILCYIWFRFEIRYGVGAVIALLHDTLLTIGLICAWGWEFNVPIVAAILTVMGYSVHDTIVVYDRIREKLGNLKTSPDPHIIDLAITETLSRTIRTASTTFVSILAFLIFGPAVTRDLSFALTFGILIGTFSSIFVAAPVLVEWDRVAAHFAARRKAARLKGDVRLVR